MAEQVDRLAEVLERAEDVHGVVTQRTNGADADWALFYAWWLLTWSDFPDVLGRTPSLAELTVALTHLDEAYRAGDRAVAWPRAYAEALASG